MDFSKLIKTALIVLACSFIIRYSFITHTASTLDDYTLGTFVEFLAQVLELQVNMLNQC